MKRDAYDKLLENDDRHLMVVWDNRTAFTPKEVMEDGETIKLLPLFGRPDGLDDYGYITPSNYGMYDVMAANLSGSEQAALAMAMQELTVLRRKVVKLEAKLGK